MHSSPSSPGQKVDTYTMKHRIRTAEGGTKELDHYARRLAIRSHCTECLGWESHPRNCTSLHCALYPFRGKTLKTRKGDSMPIKGVGSSLTDAVEQKEGGEPGEQCGDLNGAENTSFERSGRREQP
jgi:hypothetical protein